MWLLIPWTPDLARTNYFLILATEAKTAVAARFEGTAGLATPALLRRKLLCVLRQ